MGFLKPGKVVILLAGRYAGRRAVIVRTSDEGTGSRRYGHAVVAGIDRYPLNFTHLMPTRYNFDLTLKDAVPSDVFGKNDDSRTKMKNSKKTVRKLFEDSYTSGKKRWFFKKLRF